MLDQVFDVGGSILLLKERMLGIPFDFRREQYDVPHPQKVDFSILQFQDENCSHPEIHGHWKSSGLWQPVDMEGVVGQYMYCRRVVPRVLPVFQWVDESHHAFDDRKATQAYRVACDFDEVIHQGISRFTKPSEIADPPFPGALDWIRSLINSGVVFILHTCRFTQWCTSNPYPFIEPPEKVEEAIRSWFLLHGLEETYIDQIHFWRYVGKPGADVYVDDKAYGFRGHFPLILDLQGIMARAFDDRARALSTHARMLSVRVP